MSRLSELVYHQWEREVQRQTRREINLCDLTVQLKSLWKERISGTNFVEEELK